MKKNLLLLLFLTGLAFSCKKDSSLEVLAEKKVTIQKKMDGPECPGCGVLVPAPNVENPSFGGDCNSGMGTWLSTDSYHAAYFHVIYQRNPTTNLLEVTHASAGSNLPPNSGLSVTSTGITTTVNNAANVITGHFSIKYCRESVYQYNPDTGEWGFSELCENLVYNLYIDACNGVGTMTL